MRYFSSFIYQFFYLDKSSRKLVEIELSLISFFVIRLKISNSMYTYESQNEKIPYPCIFLI